MCYKSKLLVKEVNRLNVVQVHEGLVIKILNKEPFSNLTAAVTASHGLAAKQNVPYDEVEFHCGDHRIDPELVAQATPQGFVAAMAT